MSQINLTDIYDPLDTCLAAEWAGGISPWHLSSPICRRRRMAMCLALMASCMALRSEGGRGQRRGGGGVPGYGALGGAIVVPGSTVRS
ncbi:hypothetical protein MNJPNG_22140 [Cupriavidus oxalaticus]